VDWSGTGRELFSAFRATVGTADTGASVFPGVIAPQQEVPVAHAV
jgi:phosphogluconate dehydratase